MRPMTGMIYPKTMCSFSEGLSSSHPINNHSLAYNKIRGSMSICTVYTTNISISIFCFRRNRA